MSTNIENSCVSSEHGYGCHLCNKQNAIVDIEVINFTANDVVSVPSCLDCALNVSAVTWTPFYTDCDNLMFFTLGTVQSNN